ncbi:hypothetical protein HMPREF2635_09090 [Corynebacterium sp. HMSC035E02]|uniref:helix-turn-helix domain-containing protein n=1 Tax=Corynebacterium sp. HMSC035E02 TaxID=1715114 RepID=UPI0008A854E9|nr:hypothetical protein HMPREF2635_09090 [Corynebacterium sp. HMSC035E02]
MQRTTRTSASTLPTSEVLAVIHVMRQDLARRWTISELARIAHLSSSALYRAFMREVGTTPIDWLRQARVMRMAHLLRVSTDSMETIARAVGWSNRGHVTRQFKARTGLAPSHYQATTRQLASDECLSCDRRHHARRDTHALVCDGADSCAFLWAENSSQAVATSALEGRGTCTHAGSS